MKIHEDFPLDVALVGAHIFHKYEDGWHKDKVTREVVCSDIVSLNGLFAIKYEDSEFFCDLDIKVKLWY